MTTPSIIVLAIVCVFVGALLGALVVCLCVAAGKGEDDDPTRNPRIGDVVSERGTGILYTWTGECWKKIVPRGLSGAVQEGEGNA